MHSVKFFKISVLIISLSIAHSNYVFASCIENDSLFKYHSDSVIFNGKSTGLRYGATLTLPVVKKQLPAVIIVSGTGKQDRDGNMAGHPEFAQIADYLSNRGIIVLRIDDRGVGQSTGDYDQSTTGDFANDVLEAYQYLAQRPEVNPKEIGLIGHSEGGASASIAASRESRIAFLISIAGLCTSGYDAQIIQNRDIVAAASISEADKKRYDAINKIMFTTALKYADSANMKEKLNGAYNTWKVKDDEYVKNQHIEFDHFRFPIYSYSEFAAGNWYRYFIKYDPAIVLANVDIPILALNGDRDVMVSYKENLANWKILPDRGHNPDVTTIVLPGLNHLFLPCHTCTPQEYESITNSFSPDALHIISDWVRKRFD